MKLDEKECGRMWRDVEGCGRMWKDEEGEVGRTVFTNCWSLLNR
jgi:hypothetical protein